MGTTEWGDLAEWYDQKQGDEGDFWHRTLLDPALFAVIGDPQGLTVLDVPCGNGHNTRRLARLGAIASGLDQSAPMIERNREREAREPLGITYHAGDAAAMDMLDSDAFDLVVCQMGLMDIENAAGAIAEMGRVLRPGGRFAALLVHPCFEIPEASGWSWEHMGPERTVWRKVSRYARPSSGRIFWHKGGDPAHTHDHGDPVHTHEGGEPVHTMHYHRPLSWYTRALRAAGMVVTALDEPEPNEEFIAGEPEGAWMAEVPLHLLIEARKLAV